MKDIDDIIEKIRPILQKGFEGKDNSKTENVMNAMKSLQLLYDANKHYKNGEYKEVITLCEEALTLNPDDHSVLLLLGLAYFFEGKTEKALDSFRKNYQYKQDPYTENWITLTEAELVRKKIYKDFREFQDENKALYRKYPKNANYKRLNEIDLSNLEEHLDFLKGLKNKEPTDYTFYNNVYLNSYAIVQAGLHKIIPIYIMSKIKKAILEIGVKYNRLQIPEIAEKCEEPEDTIIVIANEMIKQKEIHAEYFKSTRSLVFDQTTNIKCIDNLMAKFKQWENNPTNKKE